MFGISSILFELVALIFPTALCGYAVWYFIRLKLKIGIALAVILSCIPLLLGIRYAQQVRAHFFLHSLQMENVARIKIGKNVFSGESHLTSVINSLQNSSWFSPVGGGDIGKLKAFGIKFKSGEVRFFRIGPYARGAGAIVEFIKLHDGGRGFWSYGYAFLPAFPRSLLQEELQKPPHRQSAQ